jgi:hypothetical protein
LHHSHPQVNGSIAMQMIRRRKEMRADGFLASAVAAAGSGVEPQAPGPMKRPGPPRCAYSSGMQPRRHRMHRQGRRESARAWIASGAAVTITTYARRYGVDRYTAYQDLTAIGFPLPDSAQQWAHRPPPRPRPHRPAAPRPLPDNDWITMDGRPYFVAGYTPGGAPYGTYLNELDDDHLTGMITPPRPDKPGDPAQTGPDLVMDVAELIWEPIAD